MKTYRVFTSSTLMHDRVATRANGRLATGRRTTLLRAVTLGAVVTAMLAVADPATAAPSHFNTDPYTSGCAKNSYILSSRSVSGGTAYVHVSRTCGTNWISYAGKKQTTVKRTKDHATNKWTRTETDNTSRSWSMQSYAPGTTALTATIKISRTTWTASCSKACSWRSSTTQSPPPATPTTLSAKVDAFVARTKGRYIDFDGMYGSQCVDLAQVYSRDVVHGGFLSTPYSGGAKDIWRTASSSRWTRVSRSSTPRKGDLAVWGYGTYGHIAIVLGTASSNQIRTLTQNPGATKVANLSRSGLLGYLRPKA